MFNRVYYTLRLNKQNMKKFKYLNKRYFFNNSFPPNNNELNTIIYFGGVLAIYLTFMRNR